MRIEQNQQQPKRFGAAAVEFALVAPFMMFLFVIGVDFARVFYAHIIVTNAARNGALYGIQDPTYATNTAGIQAAALQDCSDLTGVNVSSSTSTATDSTGTTITYLTVNVTYTFQTVTSYLASSSYTINQTCTMRVEPTTPRPGTY